MPDTKCTIISKTGTIDLRSSKKYLCLTMNPKSKRKGDLVVDGYDGTSVTTIENSFVAITRVAVSGNFHLEVTLTEIKSRLVGLYHDLSKKYTLIRYSITEIYLPNCAAGYQLKDVPLLGGGTNYLLSTTQAYGLVIDIHYVGKRHSGKQCIHYGDFILSMIFDRAMVDKLMIYVPSRNNNYWGLDKLT